VYRVAESPASFFKKYILRVCREARISEFDKHLQIDYLAGMLSDHVDPEKTFGDRGDLVSVLDTLKAQVESPGETLSGYRKAADRILFYHSFFPEAFRRRLVSIRFYAEAAKTFYRVVGNYGISVCGLISEEYSLWRFVLRTARMRYMF